MKAKQFKCGCGFKTTDGKAFRTHIFSLQGKKAEKGKHWSVKAKVAKVGKGVKDIQPARLAVSPGMAAAMEQSLVDEAASRTVNATADTPAPASKSLFPWLWVLLGVLVVAFAGLIVARIYLG